MLNKQSIRSKTTIYMDKSLIKDKEILIKESEKWTEIQEILFRKMLRQGGNFSIGDRKFLILLPHKII
tara:strand:- start:66 stop:269 length:204 start_codon:yes stop_codon:yes gene_type:complete